MYDNPEAWAHSLVRDVRDSQDSSPQPRQYPVTPPTEWRSYVQRRAIASRPGQADSDCLSELQQKPHKARGEQEEDEDEDEAYWASVKKLYEKIPSCARPQPVSAPPQAAPQLPPGGGVLPSHLQVSLLPPVLPV